MVQIPCRLASCSKANLVPHHAYFVPAEDQQVPPHAMLTCDALFCRAESLFAAYYFFTRKGYEVTITSVKGGKLPIDPRSVVTPYLTTTVKKGLTDGISLFLPFSQSIYNPKKSIGNCPTRAIPTQQPLSSLRISHSCVSSIPVLCSVFQAPHLCHYCPLG